MQLLKTAGLLVGVAFLSGCSSAPLIGPAGPSYLGARDLAPASASQPEAVLPPAAEPQALPNVSSSKVLSAIVFERVTGLEVDPARLIDP
jgi:hypothetical protein